VVDDLRRIAIDSKTAQVKGSKASVDEFVPEGPGGDLDDFFTAPTNVKGVGIGTPGGAEVEDNEEEVRL